MTVLDCTSEDIHALIFHAFMAGVRAYADTIRGPRVDRPAHITDDQWVNWYGATRNDDGSFSAPMSTSHLFPNPAHSKPAFLDHARALASQGTETKDHGQ